MILALVLLYVVSLVYISITERFRSYASLVGLQGWLLLAIALVMTGHDLNSTDPADLEDAKNLLIEQKPMVLAYVVDEVKDKMIAGEAALAVVYSGDALYAMEGSEDLAYVVPMEGSNIWLDGMCIPKGAANKENAEAFINYMCSTEAGLKNCEEIWYSTPLLSVREELDPEVANDPLAYPDSSIMAQCESYAGLPQNILDLYDSEWTRLKSAN